MSTLLALALYLPLGINSAPNVTVEAIVSLSNAQHVWRIHDKAHRMVCYLIMPERGMEAAPTLECLPSFFVGQDPNDPVTRLLP